MDMNFGDIKAETIKGTEVDSVYMVIASAKGLKLAIRPLVEALPVKVIDSDDYRAALVLGARLRVVAEDPDADHADAEAAFGMLGFTNKGEHASQVIGITLAPLPCGVDEARRRWKDQALTGLLVNEVVSSMAEVDVVPSVSVFAIEAWLDQEYETKLPETPPVDLSNKVAFGLTGG
jgi:hypothetical protein